MVTENLRSRPGVHGVSEMCGADLVETKPMMSMLLLASLGVGVGYLLGRAVAAPLAHTFGHQDTLTERIVGQVREVLLRTMPPGLARHLS